MVKRYKKNTLLIHLHTRNTLHKYIRYDQSLHLKCKTKLRSALSNLQRCKENCLGVTCTFFMLKSKCKKM